MTSGYDDTFIHRYFTSRTFDRDSRGSSDVSGFAYRCFHTDGEGIRAGNLQLGCRTCRSQNSYFIELSLRSNNRYRFVGANCPGWDNGLNSVS